MSLILLNLQSNQLIKLDNDNPLIIGRGNVEGCLDKRVSRSHGRVTCTVDGKIRVEALHCNPCFFTRNGVPPIQQLNKNEEETLNEGDFLGLLPNAFWFKVTTDKEIRIKKEAEQFDDTVCDENQGTNMPEEKKNTSNSQVVNNTDAQCTTSDTQNKDSLNPLPDPTPNTELTPSCSSKGFGTPEFEKTRRLPLWMYEIDEPEPSPKKHSLPNSVGGSRKKHKKLLETEIKKEPSVKLEDGGDVVEDEMTVVDIPSTSKVENVDKLPTSATDSHTEPQTIAQTQGESSNESNKKEGYESDVNERGSIGKPICQYEGNCYRKNPQHKLEFCHPGDADYVPYEERPLCKFGAACYRRSEKHKVEFRHPPPGTGSYSPSSSSCAHGSIASSPLPAKRRRKKAKRGNSDYEDDEYDLEDPFINDASSDEYLPSNLDSEEEDLDTTREDD